MIRSHRLATLAMMLLGAIGVILCVTALAGSLIIGSRLSQTNERLFDLVDESLEAIRGRTVDVQEWVEESRITTDEIKHAVDKRIREETGERLFERTDVRQRLVQLESGFERVDDLIESSEQSMKSIQRLVEIASSLGAPVKSDIFDSMLTTLDSLRSQLQQATGNVDRMLESPSADDGQAVSERRAQRVQMTARVAATVSELDDRLGQLATALQAAQVEGTLLQGRTHRYIVLAQVAAALLIAWMAAGQGCLALNGWRRYRSTSTV